MTGEFAIAVHALVYLNYKSTTISSVALADTVCTNPARIRKIMAKLKKAGLVMTKEGMDGGYFFHLDSASVTLRQIIDAVQIPIVTSTWRPVNSGLACRSAVVMTNILDSIYLDLDNCCKKQLKNITLWDIEQQLLESLNIT